MELIKSADEGKAWPKRVLFRHFRARNNQKSKIGRSNLLMEAIAKANGGHLQGANNVSHLQAQEDGVVRMKILVRKQDLKQVLELMNDNGINYANHKDYVNHNQASVVKPSSLSVEQRLNLLRKKHLLRANLAKKSHQSSWSPELQSIPEEISA